MSLVGLKLLVVGELDVDGAATQLGGAVSEVVDHCGCANFIGHLQESLRIRTGGTV